MAHRRLPQTILVIRHGRRLVESAPCHHAVAVACGSMTNGTENVVALLSAVERFLRDRKWKSIDVVGIHRCGRGWRGSGRQQQCAGLRSRGRFLAKIKLAVGAQVTTGDRAVDRRPRGDYIFEKGTLAIGDRFWLVLHVASTSRKEKGKRKKEKDKHEPSIASATSFPFCLF